MARPTPPIIPPSHVGETGEASRQPAGLLKMSEIALAEFGIPAWFVWHWYHELAELGWKTKSGFVVTRQNWRKILSGWWRQATEKEKAQYEAEYLAEQKSAAVRAWLAWVSRARARGKRNV